MSMIAAASLALAVVQAPTADEIACVLATTTEADRTAIFSGVRQGQIANSTVDRIGAQAHVCAERFGWNDTRGIAMTAAAMATVARQGLTGLLAGRQIDTVIIDRWFERQGEDMRTTPDIDQRRGEIIVNGLTEAGIPVDRLVGADGESVGNYVATLIILERVRLGLPIN